MLASGLSDQDERALKLWLAKLDMLLDRAETLVGAARAEDAPLAERIGLWIEIVALRQRVAAAQAGLSAAGQPIG